MRHASPSVHPRVEDDRNSAKAATGMVTEHALLYLGARLFAAAANLAAVAIFTRLAASDVYGGYLLIFSWAFVIYGFSGQWLGAAFFAVYPHPTAPAPNRVLRPPA